MKTFLELAQDFSEEYNLPVPSSMQGSSDAGVLQIRRLLNNVGVDIRAKSNWEACSRRVTFSAVATESQGTIDSIATENQDHVIPETFWNNTLRVPVLGPIQDKEWQSFKALTSIGPWSRFRVAAGELLMAPVPTAGHTLTFIYKTRNWIKVAGTNPQQYIESIAEDDDTPVFKEELMIAGLKFFWRRTKGMTYSKEELMYEKACLQAGSVDNVKPVIHMDDSEFRGITPAIYVPAGNWNVT